MATHHPRFVYISYATARSHTEHGNIEHIYLTHNTKLCITYLRQPPPMVQLSEVYYEDDDDDNDDDECTMYIVIEIGAYTHLLNGRALYKQNDSENAIIGKHERNRIHCSTRTHRINVNVLNYLR